MNWISVHERLPKHGSGTILVRMLDADHDNEVWHDTIDASQLTEESIKIEQVTHWCSLSETDYDLKLAQDASVLLVAKVPASLWDISKSIRNLMNVDKHVYNHEIFEATVIEDDDLECTVEIVGDNGKKIITDIKKHNFQIIEGM